MRDVCESLLDSTLLTDLQGTCSQGCHRFGKLWGELSEKEDIQKSSPRGRPGATVEELGTRTNAGGTGRSQKRASPPSQLTPRVEGTREESDHP